MRVLDLLGRREFWAVAGLVAADQLSKAAVVARLPLHDTVPVIPGFLNLAHVQNTGAAFGVLNAVEFPFKSFVVAAFALVALVAIAAYALRFGSETWVGRVGFVCVLGGAIGNLIDRATRGYVVDFLDFYWGGFHFWAFNVADAAITVGAIALIGEMLLAGRHLSPAVGDSGE
jgi:signal peptidase II